MNRILVLDDSTELGERVEALASRMESDVEVVTCGSIAEAGQVLEFDGPFELLVAGPSFGNRAGLTRLHLIAEELPNMRCVLAFSRRPSAPLRDIVRTGAVDLIQLPAGDSTIIRSLDRAMGLLPTPLVIERPAPQPVPEEDDDTESTLGTVYTIASATGGCGKTFYATNLAWFLKEWTGRKVCIVDLDLQFGEVSTALRLRPKYTIFDALQRDDAEDIDLTEHIEEYTAVHDTGVHVLAAPREPSEADRITPPDVMKIIEAVRAKFDYVIVDTPPALAESVLAAFDLSDRLYVMATLDLPSVRNMSVFLATLDRLKISTERIRLVLNKAETDVGIDIGQVTKLFAQGFESILPYAKEVSRSINLGMPVMAASPEAQISRLMATGMSLLLPAELRAQAEEKASAHKSGLRKLFSR